MSDTPDFSRVPKMAPEKAQEIARGLKCLAQSYAEAGMKRESSRTQTESQWWLTYAISLTQRPT